MPVTQNHPSRNAALTGPVSHRIGYLWMALAVLIWASWLVLTSAGRTTELSVLDLATLRAAVPALVLSPWLWRQRNAIKRIGLGRCLLLSAYGAPFAMCVGYGLTFAPVAHAGAMVPGLMPVLAAILSALFLRHQLSRKQLACFALIVLASVAIVVQSGGLFTSAGTGTGHVFFILGALCWASFTVTLKTLEVSPFLATGTVGLVSSVLIAPFWVLSDMSQLGDASVPDILFQAVFQGLIAGLLSLYAFSQALRLVGPSVSVFTALTPGVAALLAIPVLGQTPDLIEVTALFAVVLGLAIISTGNTRRAAPSHANEGDQT